MKTNTDTTQPRLPWYVRFAHYMQWIGINNKKGHKGFWKDSNGNDRIRFGGWRMIFRERDGEKENYLERFYVLSTKWLGVYIHRFWADDDDGLHDHPWHSISIVLSGAYNEEMPERQTTPYGPTITKLRRPGHPWFKIRSSTDAHRITVPEGYEGAWSLFVRFGRKRRSWGFYRHRGWEAAEVQSRADELEAEREERIWRAIAQGSEEAARTGEMVIKEDV